VPNNEPEFHALRLRSQIELAACHLAQLIRPDGRFVYRYDPQQDNPLPGYNILRHSGAIWAVQTAIGLQMAPPQLETLLQPAIDRLLRKRVDYAVSGSAFIFSRNAIKLGACGLALLVAANLGDAVFGPYRETASAIIRYIREQFQEDGTSIHKRDRKTFSPLPFRSEYYTGEAVFGLLTAAIRMGDDAAAAWGVRMLQTLARRGEGIAVQSHWMMYAAEAAYSIAPDVEILHYMHRIAEQIISWPQYRDRFACTPIACRTEALLCLARIMQKSSLFNKMRWDLIIDTIRENLALQMRNATPQGGFTRDGLSREVRIDYIQHNLSCLAGYQMLDLA
jgi:hypothetical protein